MSSAAWILAMTVASSFIACSSSSLADTSKGCRCSVMPDDGYSVERYRHNLPLPSNLPTPTCSEVRQLCSQLCSDHLAEVFDSHEGRHLAGTYQGQLAGVFFCQKHNQKTPFYQRTQLVSVSWVSGCPVAEYTPWKRFLCCGREFLPGFRQVCPTNTPGCKISDGNVGTIIGWYADCDKSNFFGQI